VLRSYLRQLGRKLRPGGAGFIHHSNLRGLAEQGGEIPSWVTRRNWRGESMSARLFRDYCREAGLACDAQELVNWVGRSRKVDRHRVPGDGLPMTDAFSSFSRPLVPSGDPTRVVANTGFAHEWRQCTTLAAVYVEEALGQPPDAAGSAPPPVPPARNLPSRARDRAWRTIDFAASLIRDRYAAQQVRRREPILNSLRRDRCPDCGVGGGSRRVCAVLAMHCSSTRKPGNQLIRPRHRATRGQQRDRAECQGLPSTAFSGAGRLVWLPRPTSRFDTTSVAN
jgi:hypothetical protein